MHINLHLHYNFTHDTIQYINLTFKSIPVSEAVSINFRSFVHLYTVHSKELFGVTDVLLVTTGGAFNFLQPHSLTAGLDQYITHMLDCSIGRPSPPQTQGLFPSATLTHWWSRVLARVLTNTSLTC